MRMRVLLDLFLQYTLSVYLANQTAACEYDHHFDRICDLYYVSLSYFANIFAFSSYMCLPNIITSIPPWNS